MINTILDIIRLLRNKTFRLALLIGSDTQYTNVHTVKAPIFKT